MWKQVATNTGEKRVKRKLANEYDGPLRAAKMLEKDRFLIETIKGLCG